MSHFFLLSFHSHPFECSSFSGCFDRVKQRLSIVLPVIFSVLNFMIQCITLLYSQITCTSYSMISYCDAEDATAVLPAWILPFPPPYPQTVVKVRSFPLFGDYYNFTLLELHFSLL